MRRLACHALRLGCLIVDSGTAMAQEPVPSLAPPASEAASAPPRAASAPQRESPREFIDSLSDNVLVQDPSQIYRRDGARREVDLGRGVVASLDEQPVSRLGSATSLPGVAGAPGRVLGLQWQRPPALGEFSYRRGGDARDTGIFNRWQLNDAWSIDADAREQSSDLVGARRRDASLGLRWQSHAAPASPDQPGAPNNTDAGATETAGRLWFDIGVHRAGVAPLQDTPVAPLPPDIATTMLRARGEWQPTALPGLRLGARVQRPGNAALQAESRSSLVFSADYTLARDAALGERLAGTRLFWREAPRLTLLGEGAALDARAAYRRIVGIDVPEAAFGGSPDGSLYAQWRSRSVADRDDSLLVLGWRRGWRLTERWTLQGRVEQASPLDGPNPVRSTRLGARLRFGGFPVQTFVTDVDLIQSSVTDSAYVATRYTTRLGSNWLTIWRFAVNHQEPHDDPHTGTTDYKLTATFGWREPSARRWALLSRYTFAATNTEQAVPNDRRAHIGAIGANYAAGPADLVSVRLSRRWERQDSRLPPGPRVSDLAMVRWTHELTERWSLSGHAGQRHDDDEGSASTYGAEIGLRVSRRVVLALGYNPRGFKDNELQIDERLRQGFTLRLRFSIEAVLGRWLDAPSPPEPERSQD